MSGVWLGETLCLDETSSRACGVLVADGVIERVLRNANDVDDVLRLHPKFQVHRVPVLLPGFVDAHSHMMVLKRMTFK
jgi:cytosine/adenosine deaminase-related metal-dependent hydrolase